MNGRITYDVKGVDEKGSFEIQRRYNDFSLLHEKLLLRWPGINIPLIPQKNIMEDSKNLFTGPSEAQKEDRRYYLEVFLRKLSRLPYLINGEEC